MKDEILDFFGWYDLHDTPILDFLIDFEQKKMVLTLENYNDQTEKCVKLSLVFKDLNTFSFQYPTEEYALAYCSVYRSEIKKNLKGYQIRLLIDMERIKDGIEFTVGEMIIGFQNFAYEGGLDREIMENKWKNEEK